MTLKCHSTWLVGPDTAHVEPAFPLPHAAPTSKGERGNVQSGHIQPFSTTSAGSEPATQNQRHQSFTMFRERKKSSAQNTDYRVAPTIYGSTTD